jgi:hypothetical protein
VEAGQERGGRGVLPVRYGFEVLAVFEKIGPVFVVLVVFGDFCNLIFDKLLRRFGGLGSHGH